MRLLPAIRNKPEVLEPVRDAVDVSLDDLIGYVNELIYNGTGYVTYGGINQTQPGQTQEQIGPAFQSLSSLAYKSDGVVFACMLTRALHFAEMRFQFRQLNQGRPGKLFGTQDLQPLETPWAGGTTGDLLTRMLMYADLAGNAFAVRRGDGIELLRPDWVSIIIGSNSDPQAGAWAADAEVLGYVYHPGGYGAADYNPEQFAASEVAHFAPIPDPEARFRGMSWVTPLLREIMADKAATEHKLRFFENPTPNMVVKFDVPDLDTFKSQIAEFKNAHSGARNAFKFMFLASGMDATPVGVNMKDLDYKLITGAGETRIAAAARTPPVIVGLSEGLQGSALNAGNYQAARRMFADGCIRPLWRNVSGSLAKIVTVPGGAELWYDDRDVAFLREDAGERADVFLKKAQATRFLVDAGYKPDTVVESVEAEDLTLLEHSGLFSVQLQAANAPRQGLFQGITVPNNASSPQGELANGSNSSNASTNGSGRSEGGRVYFSRAEDAIAFAAALQAAGARESDGTISRADILALISEHQPRELHFHIDEGALRFEAPPSQDIHLHVDEGAIRAEIDVPDVHVDAPVTRFEEGAIQVAPAEVRFEEGAIRTTVEAAPTPDVNVTVEPARVEISDGAVRVEAAPVPDVHVTVEPPPAAETRVEIAEGAVRVDAPPPAEVSVTVEAPPPAEVNLTFPDQRPRKAHATRAKDGSLTVTYEDEQ